MYTSPDTIGGLNSLNSSGLVKTIKITHTKLSTFPFSSLSFLPYYTFFLPFFKLLVFLFFYAVFLPNAHSEQTHQQMNYYNNRKSTVL